MTYMYPDNLSAKPVVWFWELPDLAAIGIGGILAAAALTILNFIVPAVLTAVYAFLSMRIAETSVKEYIQKSFMFFIFGQQFYEWGGSAS